MSDHEVEILNRKVDKVLTYLHNDAGTGEKGLVAKTAELQKEFGEFKTSFNEFVNEYDKNQAVKKAKMGAYGVVGGAILVVVKEVVQYLLK